MLLAEAPFVTRPGRWPWSPAFAHVELLRLPDRPFVAVPDRLLRLAKLDPPAAFFVGKVSGRRPELDDNWEWDGSKTQKYTALV
jgi:hypothetical protein